MQKLEFDCVRKKSSVIFYEPDEKAYYIVTKGSIDAVYNLLNKSSMVEYNSVLKQYNESLKIVNLNNNINEYLQYPKNEIIIHYPILE